MNRLADDPVVRRALQAIAKMPGAPAKPQDDPTAVLEKLRDRPPGECHSIDHRGYAYCGAFGPDRGENGNTIKSPGLHSRFECKARGHKHCVICTELVRQLGGGDYRMVA
jgi:hypothetical protein